MSQPLESAFWTLLLILGGYFILPPIMVFFTQRYPKTLRLIPIESLEKSPQSIREYLEVASAELRDLGFEPVGLFALPDQAPHVKAFFEVFANRTSREAAMVSCIFGVAPGQPIQKVHYVEFICRFRSDEISLVQTNNNFRPGAFIPRPDERTFRFPGVDNLGRLYQLHRRLIERFVPRGRPWLRLEEEFQNDVAAYLQVAFAESYEHQVEYGLLRLDAAGNCWRPTTYGAFRMTWHEMWPWKPIRMARMHRESKRWQRELAEAGEWT